MSKMGKKKDSRSKFAEAIDPRFTGIVQNSSNDLSTTKSPQGSVFQKEVISDGDQGFRDFLSKQLFDYMESHIKIVDVPVEKLDLYQFEIEEATLFSDSPLSTHVSDEKKIEENEETELPPKKKKKKKKNKEKECFKEVAVTAEWLEKQAKLFNT